MKFYSSEYTIEKSELDKLRNKVALFKSETKTKDVVVLTFLTSFRVTPNANFHEIVENSFTMDILFEPD